MKKYQLMAPGPTPVPSQVLLAMAQPILHHRTPEYEALFVEVRAGLKRLFQTGQDVLPFACSGTGVMEAAIANTLSAGDEVLLVRAGKFADRFAELCDACLIASAILLPAPADVSGQPLAIVLAVLAPPQAETSHRRVFPPNAAPRAPPLLSLA